MAKYKSEEWSGLGVCFRVPGAVWRAQSLEIALPVPTSREGRGSAAFFRHSLRLGDWERTRVFPISRRKRWKAQPLNQPSVSSGSNQKYMSFGHPLVHSLHFIDKKIGLPEPRIQSVQGHSLAGHPTLSSAGHRVGMKDLEVRSNLDSRLTLMFCPGLNTYMVAEGWSCVEPRTKLPDHGPTMVLWVWPPPE